MDSSAIPLVERTDAKSHSAHKREQALVVGVIVGLAGSLATALSGSLLTAASWFTSNQDARQWLSTAGTVLFCLTIPLIILGAFCLDWMEKNQPQHRSKIARGDKEDDGQ